MTGRGTMLACALISVSACTGRANEIDLTPLPTADAAPFICDLVPKATVERMTGVTDPLVKGSLGHEDPPEMCLVKERTGARSTVLSILVDTNGIRREIERHVREDGFPRLPEIVPGSVGYYGNFSDGKTHVGAVLVKGRARLGIELVKGPQGRDNAADVVALMKIIAPKLITDKKG